MTQFKSKQRDNLTQTSWNDKLKFNLFKKK